MDCSDRAWLSVGKSSPDETLTVAFIVCLINELSVKFPPALTFTPLPSVADAVPVEST